MLLLLLLLPLFFVGVFLASLLFDTQTKIVVDTENSVFRLIRIIHYWLYNVQYVVDTIIFRPLSQFTGVYTHGIGSIVWYYSIRYCFVRLYSLTHSLCSSSSSLFLSLSISLPVWIRYGRSHLFEPQYSDID